MSSSSLVVAISSFSSSHCCCDCCCSSVRSSTKKYFWACDRTWAAVRGTGSAAATRFHSRPCRETARKKAACSSELHRPRRYSDCEEDDAGADSFLRFLVVVVVDTILWLFMSLLSQRRGETGGNAALVVGMSSCGKVSHFARLDPSVKEEEEDDAMDTTVVASVYDSSSSAVIIVSVVTTMIAVLALLLPSSWWWGVLPSPR